MINSLKEIARSAGEATLEYYVEDIEVVQKEDNSPLTKADMASHHHIIKGLKALNPEVPIISEEAALPEYEQRKKWKKFWLVDPLDGTKEFIKKNGEFTINIALIEDGNPVMGVVYLPAKKVMYTGEKDKGSFKEVNGRTVQITSDKADTTHPLKVITSRSHKADDLEEQLKKKNIRVGEIVKAGSSLKFCYVAEGRADIYPRMGPTMEWDVAAGDAVYRYSAKQGVHASPISYNKKTLKNEGFIIGL